MSIISDAVGITFAFRCYCNCIAFLRSKWLTFFTQHAIFFVFPFQFNAHCGMLYKIKAVWNVEMLRIADSAAFHFSFAFLLEFNVEFGIILNVLFLFFLHVIHISRRTMIPWNQWFIARNKYPQTWMKNDQNRIKTKTTQIQKYSRIWKKNCLASSIEVYRDIISIYLMRGRKKGTNEIHQCQCRMFWLSFEIRIHIWRPNMFARFETF